MRLVPVRSFACAAVALFVAATPVAAENDADNMANLPGLAEQTQPGTLRCPDGSTRPWQGEKPSELVITMACSTPPGQAAQNAEAADVSVKAKNAEAEQRAALSGEAGPVAGLKATAATGRLGYLLSFRVVWLAIVLGGIWLVVTILRRLIGGGK